MNLDRIKSLYERSKGADSIILKQIEKYESEKVRLEKRLKLIEEAQAFLQKVAQDTQSHLKIQVENIVNLALDTCFPGEYVFHMNFNISRGKTDAELSFVSQKTGREIDPMNASGGGVVDLTSFALRIAAYALERGTDNVIILDEPFRFLSRDLQFRAGEILQTLSDKMNLQVILVTHISELIDASDKVFEVKKDEDGISRVKVLEER